MPRTTRTRCDGDVSKARHYVQRRTARPRLYPPLNFPRLLGSGRDLLSDILTKRERRRSARITVTACAISLRCRGECAALIEAGFPDAPCTLRPYRRVPFYLIV